MTGGKGRAAVALVFFFAPLSQAAEPGQTKSLVQGLELRMSALTEEWEREHEKFLKESLAIVPGAAALDAYAPESKKAAEAKAEVSRIAAESAKAEAGLAVEMTVIARRLTIYKETGKLPPPPGREEVDELARFFDHPWAKTAGVRPLERDVLALEKQIRRYDRLLHPLQVPAILPPAKEKLPAVAFSIHERPEASVRPELERDAGRARPAADPVPPLISSLSSPEARERALAADELGRLGKAARPAVRELRKALSDADPRVRASAILALSEVGAPTPDLLEDLRRSLKDKNEDVRFSARAALDRFGGPAYLEVQ